ncbi:MAG TPA: hypothetical protein VHQ42_05420 [Candidatus Limnocylindria bacterium]|nr:hypothetical protein [Candidatus Limnocylindria bacterium]
MPRASLMSTPSSRSARRAASALLLSLSVVLVTPVAARQPEPAADPAVITAWNAIAASTIPPNPAAFLNYAFVHLAMYNAVVGITGEYEQYRWDMPAPRHASPQAAAAAAAHRVLVTYFPAAAGNLDAQLAASLALVPDGGPQDKGIAYGVRAADHLIALRAGDGRGAAVTVPTATEAGDWAPTSPNTSFATPWLGGVRPLALESLTQLDPGPPPAIGSAVYRAELAETRAIGAAGATGGARSLEQELTARYFAALPFGPMEAGLRGVAIAQDMDISDSARLFAATNTAIADAIGTAWNAKLKYLWWRPISAIRETFDDGDPATVADGAWGSLLPAPPYPEWPSGLCSVIGAMSTSLQELTGGVNLTMGTDAVGYRTWTSKATLDQTAIDARVWSGIHFRTSDVVAIDIGTDAATYILDRYFAPAD